MSRAQGYIDALKIARRRIRDGSKEFICHALPNDFYGRKLARYISDAIERECGWTSLNAYIAWVVFKGATYPTLTQLREYRLRYLHHLIQQYEMDFALEVA